MLDEGSDDEAEAAEKRPRVSLFPPLVLCGRRTESGSSIFERAGLIVSKRTPYVSFTKTF